MALLTNPTPSPTTPPNGDTRFDRRMAEILRHATEVFCEKGYEGASMRDLSRATGMSLAGLYYYFESKEKLLYLIQKHTFRTVVDTLRRRLAGVHGPEQRIRVFIHNHLEYFLANSAAMSVLSHEDEVLSGAAGAEIAAIKREYYRICVGLVADWKRGGSVKSGANGGSRNGRRTSDAEVRIAVLSLFGMMNWIYTWHRPRTDGDAGALAREMGDIFLYGISRSNGRSRAARRRKQGNRNTQ